MTINSTFRAPSEVKAEAETAPGSGGFGALSLKFAQVDRASTQGELKSSKPENLPEIEKTPAQLAKEFHHEFNHTIFRYNNEKRIIELANEIGKMTPELRHEIDEAFKATQKSDAPLSMQDYVAKQLSGVERDLALLGLSQGSALTIAANLRHALEHPKDDLQQRIEINLQALEKLPKGSLAEAVALIELTPEFSALVEKAFSEKKITESDRNHLLQALSQKKDKNVSPPDSTSVAPKLESDEMNQQKIKHARELRKTNKCWEVEVQAGYTLESLSRGFGGIPLDLILEFNPQVKDPDTIFIGQKLYIPVEWQKIIEDRGRATNKKP